MLAEFGMESGQKARRIAELRKCGIAKFVKVRDIPNFAIPQFGIFAILP